MLEIPLLDLFWISKIYQDSTIVKFRFFWKALGETDCVVPTRINIIQEYQIVFQTSFRFSGIYLSLRFPNFQHVSRFHHRRVPCFLGKLCEKTIVLNGDGLNSALLAEANIGKSDVILAVTDDDKTNMLAAVRAKMSGCPRSIVLINDPSLVPLMAPLGIDAFINPRATTVSSILRHIRHGRVRGVYSIGDAEAEIIEAKVLSTSPIAGQKISDIDFPEGVLVGGVLKSGIMMKPVGTTRIEEGDVIALFSLAKDITEVERLLQVSIDFF